MKTLFWTGVWTFVLDQASKIYVVHILNLKEVGTIEVFPPYLVFQMAWNYGINFGIFSGSSPYTRWILIAVALIISVIVYRWMVKERPGPWAMASAGMLIGGAFGNIIDRLLYGAVADFLNMSCCGYDNPYSYNVADIGIFAGAIGLVLFTGGKKAA